MTKPNGRNNEKIGLLGHMVIWQGRWIAPPFYGLDQMPKRLRLEPKCVPLPCILVCSQFALQDGDRVGCG